jgi:hypothetical protein
MEDTDSTLVVLLCMHRSGSSLTASILQQLGMSLGPFELIEATPTNPYGHFEAKPFHILNRRVQDHAFGFPDDLPRSPQVLERFLQTGGRWSEAIEIPGAWVDEGAALIQRLRDSGPVAGFKDPRTVLVWPFWRRVLKRFPDLRTVLLPLLRSPHEIAMSLCSRSGGRFSYWTALDVVDLHFRRLAEIQRVEDQVAPSVLFGSPRYLEELAEAVGRCGLPWCEELARGLFDRSCVHHKPAVVVHPAQEALNQIHPSDPLSGGETNENARQLAADARSYESMLLRRIDDAEAKITAVTAELQETRGQLAEVSELHQESRQRLELSEGRLIQTQEALGRTTSVLRETSRALEETRATLEETRERFHASQEALRSSQLALHETQATLGRSQTTLARIQELLGQSQESLVRVQADFLESEERLRLARQREDELASQCRQLRTRLERFETHPILGPALRGRRGLRAMLAGFRSVASSRQRLVRLDQPDRSSL